MTAPPVQFSTPEGSRKGGRVAGRTHKLNGLKYRVDLWFAYDPPPTREQVLELLEHITAAAVASRQDASERAA